MLERVSPLVQRQPAAGLSHRHCATLLQYHAWPERYEEMARTLASHAGAAAAPAPGKAAPAGRGTLLRIHPQRLWLLSEEASAGPALSPEIGGALSNLGRIHASVGDRRRAEEIVAGLEANPNPCASCIAEILIALGRYDEAFRWLDVRIWDDDEQGGGYMPKIDPLYDPLRDDPRFVTFLREAGLE